MLNLIAHDNKWTITTLGLPPALFTHRVEVTVVDLLITEHRRHRIIADIEADPDPAQEHLHGHVLF